MGDGGAAGGVRGDGDGGAHGGLDGGATGGTVGGVTGGDGWPQLTTSSSPTHGLSRRVYVSESGHGKLTVCVAFAWVTEISYPVSCTLHLGSGLAIPPVNGELPDGASNCTVSCVVGCPSQDVDNVASTTVPAEGDGT